jgi:hypothetical protein
VRRLKSVDIAVETAPAEELHEAETQLRGTIKYLEPTLFQIGAVEANLRTLQRLGKIDLREFTDWVRRTNPRWLPHVSQTWGRVHKYRFVAGHGWKALARRGLEYLLHKLA